MVGRRSFLFGFRPISRCELVGSGSVFQDISSLHPSEIWPEELLLAAENHTHRIHVWYIHLHIYHQKINQNNPSISPATSTKEDKTKTNLEVTHGAPIHVYLPVVPKKIA